VATATAPATDLYIFEDDCELTTAPAAIAHWVDQVKQSGAPWDILLLGANEYVESQAGWIRIDETAAEFPLTRVQRFWGTHAMVIRPTAARAALKVFAEAQRAGTFLPADWMWNEAIRQEGLLAFGPLQPKSFCRQVPGLVSAITGIMRLGQI
jgi:GR25 family glycosyltransferase involved in LPS biosynthesis